MADPKVPLQSGREEMTQITFEVRRTVTPLMLKQKMENLGRQNECHDGEEI